MTDETREQIAKDSKEFANKHLGSNGTWYDKECSFRAGAERQHPISYEAGRKAGIEHMANVVISGIDARELDAHGRIPASTVKAIIKRELEALKTEKV